MIQGLDGCLELVDVDEVDEQRLLVHDPSRADPGLAFSLAKLAETPEAPTRSGSSATSSARSTRASRAPSPLEEQLAALLNAGDT